MKFLLLWGCDPNRQFELNWIYHLLSLAPIVSFSCTSSACKFLRIASDCYPILIESGLKRLERNPSQQTLDDIHRERVSRLSLLNQFNQYSVIHLSDEEGYDADSFYHLIPRTVQVYRNFHHPRLLELHPNIKSFPIGPRHVFINSQSEFIPSSNRAYPWSFMGTLWPRGSRKLSVSLFLTHLPSGFYLVASILVRVFPCQDINLSSRTVFFH